MTNEQVGTAKEDRRVIPWSRIPNRYPLNLIAIGWLLGDRFHIPPWGWGCFWTLMGILFIGSAVSVWKQKFEDPYYLPRLSREGEKK